MKKEIKKLDTYLKEKIGVGISEIVGYVIVLRRDLKAVMLIKPKNYAYSIKHSLLIKKGTSIKILGPNKMGFQPLGHSTYLLFEIVYPQVEIIEVILEAEMEEIIEVAEINIELHESKKINLTSAQRRELKNLKEFGIIFLDPLYEDYGYRIRVFSSLVTKGLVEFEQSGGVVLKEK